MIQTCGKCSRPNPGEAIYCHYDGFPLGGRDRSGGPVAVGAVPFNSPFVFPDGHACRSFNELARACNQRWDEARDLLHQGLLESFLTGLGRLDLVQAARAARAFPDPDRALDQLLARLPCDKEALAPPRLQVETSDVNLGTLEPGVDRYVEIQLENGGERLLYGEVTIRVPEGQQVWLSLDDKPGTVRKAFQFQDRATLRIHLDRDRLRASAKPLTATLVLESSGGKAKIPIKAEVPIKPFPDGPFAGATRPRRVAATARDKPKEAAPLFESGAVAEWYRSNGWEYPVQGPAASGLGAVQQFFEALGLAPAPKVVLNAKHIDWSATAGSTLEEELVLQTAEKKYVYAHATADQPWVEVERAELKGARATIKVRVPRVPDRPGETLKATLTVQSNGDQCFLVPVTLAITGATRSANPFAFDEPEEEEPIPVVAVADEPVPVVPALPPPVPPPLPPPATDDLPVVELAEPDAPKRTAVRGKPPPPVPEKKPRPAKVAGGGGLRHLVPLGALALALGFLVLWDAVYPEVAVGTGGGADALRLELLFNQDNSRFGLEVFDPLDREAIDRRKGLFPTPRGKARPSGDTGNVCLRFGGDGMDGFDFLFGQTSRGIARRLSQGALPAPRVGWRTVFLYEEYKVEVAQEVELVRGLTDAPDTCLVRYTLENKGPAKQTVGLRVLLDTFIGGNDGVPFTIPGEAGLVTTRRTLTDKEVPQYLEAIENPADAKNPGTAARVGLRFEDSQVEPPSRVVIGGYREGFAQRRWDVEPAEEIGTDSCVVLYWADAPLSRGEKRVLGYTYGLGEVSGDGRLALSAPAVVTPRSEFVVTAYVYQAEAGQTFKVQLPEGLTLAGDEAAEKTVPANAERAVLSWRVRAGEAGRAPLGIRVEGAGAASKPVRVQVRDRSIFG